MNLGRNPNRPVRLGPSDVLIDRRGDGTIYVRSPHPLGSHPETMSAALDHWAAHASYRTFLAEKLPSGAWRNLTYAEAQFFARRIGQALIDRGLSVERPVLVLSGYDIEHALLGLGAVYAGIPYVPVSTACSLGSNDHGHLRDIVDLMSPGLVFASSGAQYEPAIRAVLPRDAELVAAVDPLEGTTLFSSLADTPAGPALHEAHSRIHAGTVLSILFTSRTAEAPRGMISTHRMWSSNQEMARAYFAFLADEPPVIVNWLPDSPESSGSADAGLVLYNGGSLYMDHGPAAPGKVDETARILRRIAPTMHWSGPRSLETLAAHLRADPALRKNFFSRLRLLYCAGAGLPRNVWDDLARISREECGDRVPALAGLGSTGTVPHALFGLPAADRPGLLGVPAQGVELKLVPSAGGRMEVRLRGPNVPPGYWRRPDLTREAFDEEGFFKLGETLRLADEANPALGFDLN